MRTKRARARTGAVLAAAAAIAPGTGWVLPAPADADESGAGASASPARAAQAAPSVGDAAEHYAQDYDVDAAEARQRLADQGQLANALGQLRRLAGDRLAGAWIEHRPDFHGVVRLTGPVADQAAFDAAVAGSPAPIEVRTDASLSLAQLQAEQAKVEEALPQVMPGAATGIDEPSGSVMLYAPAADGAERASSGAAVPEVQALTDAPVRVSYQRAELESMDNYGGDRLSTCTSGFAAIHTPTGQTGIVTAGHCPARQDYQGYDGSRHRLTRVAFEVSAVTDVAFYSSDQPAHPEFYADSRSARQPLVWVQYWEQQVEGQFVCHQGRTTGFSCGTITDRASTECDSASSCDPTWVRVEGPSLNCAPGDSGGPWFESNLGYGIFHAGGVIEDDPCLYAIYTPIDYKFTRLNAVALNISS